MSSKTFITCDKCQAIIPFSKSSSDIHGFEVQGNVLAVVKNGAAGLIGNVFLEQDSEGKIKVDEIRAFHYCKPCMLKLLGYTPQELLQAAASLTDSKQESN
jgi:hypothetical protein